MIAIAQGSFVIDLNSNPPVSGWWCDISFRGVGRWWPGRVWGGVLIPLWMPFLVFALPSVIGWWRTRKPPSGHCAKCGYDLRGSPGLRCPECGEHYTPRKQGTVAIWFTACVLHAAFAAPLFGLASWAFSVFVNPPDSGIGPFGFAIAYSLLVVATIGLVGTPYWALVWSRLYVKHRNRRLPEYSCPTCGYNLTDNVSGVCPECGDRVGGKT